MATTLSYQLEYKKRIKMSELVIKDLHVSVETEDGTKEILRGVDLTIKSGETHAIMGPNGSGKSTLAYSIAGHPKYEITGGSVHLDGLDILEMSVDERAKAGLFLAMQYPVEVPGVSVSNFSRTLTSSLARFIASLVDGIEIAFTSVVVVAEEIVTFELFNIVFFLS